MDFLEDHKIPLGGVIEDFITFLRDHADWLFDFISRVLEFLIDGMIDILLFVPPLLLIALIAGFAWWLHRSLWLVVGSVLSLLLDRLSESESRTTRMALFRRLAVFVGGFDLAAAAACRERLGGDVEASEPAHAAAHEVDQRRGVPAAVQPRGIGERGRRDAEGDDVRQ